MATRKRVRGLRGQGTIRQLGSGSWQLRVPYHGKHVTYGVYASEVKARIAQGRWMETHLLPGDDIDAPATALSPTVKPSEGPRCNERFLEWQEAKRLRRSKVKLRKSKRGGAASTAARDIRNWNKWWAPVIGEMMPTAVTESDLTVVLARLEDQRAPNTLRTHWATVNAFLNWMLEVGLIERHPGGDISVDVDPVEDRVRDIVVPDFRYIDMLAERLGTGQDRLIFECLLGTGGRRSEVAGLLVGDVDLVAKRVWIRRPVLEVEGKLETAATPKGGKQRAIIVSPHLAQLIREHLLRRGMPHAGEPLFVGPKGGHIRWNNYLARTLRPLIQSTAVRWAVGERRRLMVEDGLTRIQATALAVESAQRLTKLTPHHLRHTAAAFLWASGATDLEIQEILGHSDIATSRRLYGHLLEGAQDAAFARVEQMRQALKADWENRFDDCVRQTLPASRPRTVVTHRA